MRALLCLFLLAGCASTPRGQFSGSDEDAEYHDFFYGHILKAPPSEDDAEDRAFFYGRHR